MNKLAAATLLWAGLLMAVAGAQDFSEALDMSATQNQISEFGLPTVTTVDALSVLADRAYAGSLWKEAITLYQKTAKDANWLANLIAAGVTPYYGASAEEQSEYPAEKAAALIPCEEAANRYKMLRNRAIARTGICYYRTGKYAEALPYLLKTLELVSIQEDPVWQEARETMYQIIQFRY